MLEKIKWPESRQYRSNSSFEPIDFYLECLINSNKLDLLLGYFSSSAINILSIGFATFIYKGGRLRLIINDILLEKDKKSFEKGINGIINDDLIDIHNIESLKETLSRSDQFFFDCLSWLIKHERIQFKIIRPKNKRGVSHFKSGIFYDNKSKIAFTSSCNFSANALLYNLEELSVIDPIDGPVQNVQLRQKEDEINRIFNNSDDTVEYLDISEVKDTIIRIGNERDITDLIDEQKKLLKDVKNSKLKKHNKFLNKVEESLEEYNTKPRFPYNSSPREYQTEAYRKWLEKNCTGIFAMATGTGKTITALNCVLEEFNKEQNYYILILVPSNILLVQWEREVRHFNFRNIMLFGGGNDGIKEIPNYVSNFKAGLKKNMVMISTYDSFVTDTFQKHFSKIQEHFTLIADEAHNIGATNVLKRFEKLNTKKKIGLSATITRKYDIDGTNSIKSFFNDDYPYCYSYSMKKAMISGWLSDYYYYPKIVYLNEDEQDLYNSISKELLKYFNFESGKYKDYKIVKTLLLKRKNIIHQAENKLLIYKNIIRDLYENDKLKYVFTYVPIGSDNEGVSSTDEKRFIYKYLNATIEIIPNIKASTYTSYSDFRDDIIRGFSEGKIDMLLAMKMLDEGVDIPRAQIGIFASSTGNPREYIQRRGRLLRMHDKKDFAYIYDMIVVPKPNYSSELMYRFEKNMVFNELIRVAHFSSLSMNFKDSKNKLQDICDRYDLDLDLIISELNYE